MRCTRVSETLLRRMAVSLSAAKRHAGHLYGHGVNNTYDEVTSQSLRSRYDRHYVGITRYNALS